MPHDSIDASNVKFVRVGGTVKVKGELFQREREDGTLEFVSLDPPPSPKSYADVGSEGKCILQLMEFEYVWFSLLFLNHLL